MRNSRVIKHLQIICYICLLVSAFRQAKACTFVDQSSPIETFYKKSKAVFTAHIKNTEEDISPNYSFISDSALSFSASQNKNAAGGGDGVPIIIATFNTIEVFKGSVPKDYRVRDMVYGPGNCSTPLIAGFGYLFFISQNDNGFAYVGLPTGTKVLNNTDDKPAQELINKVRMLSKTKKND